MRPANVRGLDKRYEYSEFTTDTSASFPRLLFRCSLPNELDELQIRLLAGIFHRISFIRVAVVVQQVYVFAGGSLRGLGLVEKPGPETVPSRAGRFGRLVFAGKGILKHLCRLNYLTCTLSPCSCRFSGIAVGEASE